MAYISVKMLSQLLICLKKRWNSRLKKCDKSFEITSWGFGEHSDRDE